MEYIHKTTQEIISEDRYNILRPDQKKEYQEYIDGTNDLMGDDMDEDDLKPFDDMDEDDDEDFDMWAGDDDDDDDDDDF